MTKLVHPEHPVPEEIDAFLNVRRTDEIALQQKELELLELCRQDGDERQLIHTEETQALRPTCLMFLPALWFSPRSARGRRMLAFRTRAPQCNGRGSFDQGSSGLPALADRAWTSIMNAEWARVPQRNRGHRAAPDGASRTLSSRRHRARPFASLLHSPGVAAATFPIGHAAKPARRSKSDACSAMSRCASSGRGAGIARLRYSPGAPAIRSIDLQLAVKFHPDMDPGSAKKP